MKRAWCCATLLVCVGAALAAAPARGADAPNACTTASLFNPEAGTGGMGGTGAAPGNGSGGMGGTGAVAGSGTGGIGGTGTTAANGTGGMGGTGAVAQAGQLAPGAGGMGGTGIVGIVTGFASICVNNVEVHYDARTPVAMNGQAASTRDLAVGQHVVVHAGTVGGQLRAIGIGAIDAVNGTVTSVNPGMRSIQVLGQNVRLDNPLGQDIASIKPGAAVRVSGLRTADGVIMASRIDAAPAGAQGSLLGTVSSITGNTAMVNGTRVTLPERTSGQALTPGAEVFVAGSWNGTELRANRVETHPVRDALARTERAIVEGYVTRQQGNQLTVGSIPLQVSNDVRISGGNLRDAGVGRTVQVELRRSGDRWIADRVTLTRPFRSGGEGRPNSTSPDGSRGNQGSGSGNDSGNTSGSNSNSGSSESSNSGSSNSGSSNAGSTNSESSGSGSSNSGSSGSGSSGSGSSSSGSSISGSSGSGTSGSGSSGSSSGGSGLSSGGSGASGSSSGSSGGRSGMSGSSGTSGGSAASGASSSGGSGASGAAGRSTSGGSISGGSTSGAARSGGAASSGSGRSSGSGGGGGGGGRR